MSNKLLPRIATAALIGGGAIGVGAALASLEDKTPQGVYEGIQDLSDKSYAPEVPVSPTGTDVLIRTNDLLREAGPFAIIGALSAAAGIAVVRRRSSAMDAMVDRSTIGSRKVEVFMGALMITAMGVSSGIGAEAANGANKPVEFTESLLEASDIPGPGLVITQHRNSIPFNHSSLSESKVGQFQTSLNSQSTATPFMAVLGDIRNPNAKSNPSSAPILALPAEALKSRFGISLEANETEKPCDEIEVIVGEQLGAKVGDEVILEGQKVKVAKTVDIKPGLDRVFVAGSLEQMKPCMFEADGYSGMIVKGFENEKSLQKHLDEQGINYTARTLDEYKEAYANFWSRSVKPPEMQLVLLVLTTGAVALGYMMSSKVAENVHQLAGFNSQGVTKANLKASQAVRFLNNSVRSAIWSVGPTIGLSAANGSSQFGVEFATSARVVGTGLGGLLIAGLCGIGIASRKINKIDTSTEIGQ